MEISAAVALILICSELTVHPQAGFSLTRFSGLRGLEVELGSLYERIGEDFSSEMVFCCYFFLRKQLFYVPSICRNRRQGAEEKHSDVRPCTISGLKTYDHFVAGQLVTSGLHLGLLCLRNLL